MSLLNPTRPRPALVRACVPVALLVLACEPTGPQGPAPVSLSLAPLPAALTVGTGTNSLKITRVQFVLAETEMAQAATRDPLLVDPILINLPLGDAMPRKVTTASMPGGRYTGLATRLRAAGSESGFGTLHPDWPAGVSVRVAGSYTDATGVAHDFTFTSAADAQIQIAFARPITVDAPRNVTLAVNVARWFRNGHGAVLDPRNGANAAAINANISASFAAFQDDDQNGVEDDPADVDDDSTEVEHDTTDVDHDHDTTDVDHDHDTTEVDDDTTDVEHDTTDVERSAISLPFQTKAVGGR